MSSGPKFVGPYKILDEIGQGKFATVYLAYGKDDTQPEQVAVKALMPPIIQDPASVARFHQEAQILRKLEHPNVIKIYDSGATEDTFFIAMEYISGGSLRKLIENGPLPRKKAMGLIRGVSNAINFAHNHEDIIIHRDIKPENILIDSETMRPILADFGLVKRLSVEYIDSFSGSGGITGTLNYMPSESLKGQKPSIAMDIYAFAITCFEILTGQRPYSISAMDLFAKSPDDLIPPIPLVSTRMSTLGKSFDSVIQKATHPEPEERFQNIDELLDAFERANLQADRAKEQEDRDQASKLQEIVERLLETENYNPGDVLPFIEQALQRDPINSEILMLKGRLKFEQGQYLEALDIQEQAFLLTHTLNGKEGRAYLDVLSKVGHHFLKSNEYHKALPYYETMKRLLVEDSSDDIINSTQVQNIWQEALIIIADFFRNQDQVALKLTAFGEKTEGYLKTLSQFAELLKDLQDADKRSSLQEILNGLRNDEALAIIDNESQMLNELLEQDEDSEIMFDHYERLDQAFQILLDLDPNNSELLEKRQTKLLERAEHRARLAQNALEKEPPQFDNALRHYYSIKDIEEARYPNLSEKLGLDLASIIETLQQNLDLKQKYLEIRHLMSEGDHQEALLRLEDNFIKNMFYDYEDIPRLTWELVYAKRHGGEYPLGWDTYSVLEALGDRVMDTERERIKRIQTTLQMWTNLSEQINKYQYFLIDSKQHINKLEAQLNLIEKRNKTIDFSGHRQKVQTIQNNLEICQNILEKIQANLTPSTLLAWSQVVDDIQTEMKDYHSFEERPNLFKQNESQLRDIEEDPSFELLQKITQIINAIRQTQAEVQISLQAYLEQLQLNNLKRFTARVTIIASILAGITWPLIKTISEFLEI